jgi:hypothetical protein
MSTLKTLTITDDSGFVAIVNADRYHSFVDGNWELSQLLNHFVHEMNNDNLIIWQTGAEGNWQVQFVDKQTTQKSFREFSTSIEVTDRQLFLTNYEDLTMAAQFEDEKVPAKQNAHCYIQLDNGKYKVTVRQLFSPNQYVNDGNINFEVVIQADAIGNSQYISEVFWRSKKAPSN